MPFDMEKLKGFYLRLLKIAILLTIVIGFVIFITAMASGANPISFIGRQDFIMIIVFLILEYTAYLILTGKFQPQLDSQPRQQRQPRRAPVRQPMPTKEIPVQILEVDTCSFCGEEKPLHLLREFKDDHGNLILICESCVKKEGGK